MESQISKVNNLCRTYNLNLSENDDCYVLNGIVFIMARIDDYSISKNYTIRIEITKINIESKNTYSMFIPKIQVLNGMQSDKYPHVYSNKYICLDTDLMQYIHLLNNSFDYSEWFKFYFYAFAVKYEFYIEYGNNIGEDRSHGDLGILESLMDYLNVPPKLRSTFGDSIKTTSSVKCILNTIKKYCYKHKKEYDWFVKTIIFDYLKSRKDKLNE